jgi:hypothetical protein
MKASVTAYMHVLEGMAQGLMGTPSIKVGSQRKKGNRIVKVEEHRTGARRLVTMAC